MAIYTILSILFTNIIIFGIKPVLGIRKFNPQELGLIINTTIERIFGYLVNIYKSRLVLKNETTPLYSLEY